LHEDDQPKVSAIVINAKGTRQLEECLKYLTRTSYPNYDIAVVDCLTSDLSTWIREFFPNVKVIHYDYDIGASASHNIGEKATGQYGKYLAFLDNDALVTENWLTELVKVMEDDAKIGVAQAKILIAKDSSLLDHTGIAIDALGTWQTTRGLKANEFKDLFEIFAASSAGCIVRREAFNEAGGFDHDYFIYDDDTDFCFRIRLLGYKIAFVPSAIIFHSAEPIRPLAAEKLYHSVKNRMCTMLKNYELGNLCWRFSLYLTLTFLAGIGFGIMRKIAEAKAVFRSAIYPLRNIRKIWAKRVLVQAKRRIRDSELFRSGLLRNDARPTVLDLRIKLRYLRK